MLSNLPGVIQPATLEERNDYLMRFESSAEMKATFPSLFERYEVASSLFKDRWDRATITIARADGSRFFVD